MDPSDQYHAAPLENDMFEWHFTIRGAPGTDFQGGIYHGRILLPPEYPFKPPNIVFLTPSGRFETNTKVCLSFSAFHPELWQPAWGIRLILEALISFLPTPADGAIGALDWSSEERKRLAIKSKSFACPVCGKIERLIPERASATGSSTRFQREIEELQRMQAQQHKKDENSSVAEKSGQEKSTAQATNNGETEQDIAQTEPALLDEETDPEDATGAWFHDDIDFDALEDTELLVGSTRTGQNSEAEQTSGDGECQEEIPPVELSRPATTPASDEREQVGQELVEDPSNVVDSVLHIAIIGLSIICYLLMRKIMELLKDLEALRLQTEN